VEKKVSPESKKIAQEILLETRIHGERLIAIIRIIICIILFIMVIIVFYSALQRENKNVLEAFLEPAFVTERKIRD
jgi:ABC-type sulfate transport system permease subunit